jgi:hypothetical protein
MGYGADVNGETLYQLLLKKPQIVALVWLLPDVNHIHCYNGYPCPLLSIAFASLSDISV